MPDKRYSLKVNGQDRTVKADVFNENIDKFVNDMPDATIMMYKGVEGQDGYESREYRLRDISNAYDAGFSFSETDTPIYVNTKAPETPSNNQQDNGPAVGEAVPEQAQEPVVDNAANVQNEAAAYEEPQPVQPQTVEQPTEQQPESPTNWRDEPLNIGIGGEVTASTQGEVYDTLFRHFGNVRATAKPGEHSAYDQTWHKAIEMGIEDDDNFNKTRRLVGTINRQWAGMLAKSAVDRIMEKMPSRTSDIMSDLSPVYYDKSLQEQLFRDAASMGNEYEQYINMFVKPRLKEALKQKYGFSDSGVSGVTGLFSNWEYVKNRQESDDVAELLSQHFAPAINSAFAAGDQRANAIVRAHNESVSPYSDPGLDFGAIFAVRKGNEARDPEKILKSLQESVGTSMLDMLENEELSNEIFKRAEAKGMSEVDYFDKFVAPQLRQSLSSQFEKMAIERELPKSTVEYVLRGLEDSVIGMVANRLMLTESQQQYRNMADAMTNEGKNPDVQPGLLAEGSRLATGMASDFWLWAGWGKIGSKATQELVGQRIAAVATERHVTKEVARRLVEEESKQYMGKGIAEGIMRHVPQSAITMGGAEATTEAVRGIRDREEIGEIIGNTIGAGTSGAMTGTAFGVTGGVMSRVTSQLSGAKRIMGKLAGLEVEAATMYTTEEIQRMANGEDAFSNPLEGLLEANVKLGFIKASANPMETGVKLMEAIKHPVKTAKGMTKPDLGTLNEADVADLLESSEGLELIDALTAMRPGRSTTGQREGTISAEEAQRGAEAYRQYMTDPDRPWERKQKVARLLGGMVPPPGREISAELSGSEESGYTLRTRDIDGQCVRELHFDSLDEAVKAQNGMTFDLTMNETEALAQQIDMYDASQRFSGYLEEEYQRAAMKLRNGEELTDGEKQAVYLRQHSGDLLDIHNKIGDGQELSEEEQRLGDIYKERFGDYVRSGRASEAFAREFEEGAGLPEGAMRQAVDGHSFADAEAMDSPENLVEIGNGTWRTGTEQRIVDAYHEAMRQHIEEAQAASPNVRPDEYGRGAEPFIGERVMLGGGASGEAGAANGTGANEPPAATISPEQPAPTPPSTPSEETIQRRGQAYDRGASVAQDQSALPGINYDIKLADARLLALFPKEDARLNRIRREIMQAVESGDDVKADALLAQVSQQLTPQQAEAIETYRDLVETQRGVVDSVAQQAADYEEQRRSELEPLTATDGSITPLTLTDGSVVYYKAGDLSNKYGGLIVATGNGEQRQIPTSSVQGIGNKQMASELITAEIDQFAQELEAAYKGIATGQVFIPGQQSDLVIAGRQFMGTVIKSDPVNGVVFQLEDGSQYQMTPADAAKAVADADAIKIQAQLEQEKQATREAQRSERYQSGIVGYSDGHPDYSAPESDPKTVADYLLQDVQDDKQRDRILNNIQGEKDLLTQNTQQAWEEYQRAQNALEMADDNQKKAKAIQDMEGARRRIVELQERQKKWGEIRQAIMTQEERTRFESDRAKTIHKHLTESRKSLSIEQQSAEENPLPTGQELLAQYNEQSEAEAAVTALSKETTRQWREELYPQLSDVRQMVSEYQQGLMELSGDELRHLTDVLANLERQESALVARNKALKQLYSSLGRLYSSRNNASLTPHERKLNQLGREKDRVKKMKLAREVYAGDEIAASILEDDEPHDVYEFVSRNLGYGSINWEGLDRGGHHVRGLQEELGRDKTRSLEKGSDTYGFNAFLAPTGAGSGIDEIVHSIYESQPDGQRYSTEEIKDAILDMLQSAQRPTDISHRIENNRIAAAEQAWLANEAAEREQMDAEAQERQNAIEDYQDYLNTLSSELPTDDAESFISGLLADEIAEIEQERMTYEDALRELYTDETETNIDQYGETNIQQESTAPASGRVDKEPQRGTVEEGAGVRQEVVPVKEADKPAHETGDTERPETQPERPGEGTGTVDADRGTPLEAETDDLAAPEGLEERISINDDYTTGESDNGEIYLQTVTIDGQHEVVKVDAPDEKGNYNGSYYEYDGKRFGDLQEVVRYIDGVNGQAVKRVDVEGLFSALNNTGEAKLSDHATPVDAPQGFTQRLEAAKSDTNTNPTEAQKAAGNYKKGHLSFGGYDYTIENPKGSVRSGTDQNGRPWSVTMQDTYGYILGKIGVDGDHIDMYINDEADLDTWNGRVFVIDQKNEDGTFDEHKVMYGYPSWSAAKHAYERNFEPGWWDKHVMQMMGAMKTDFDQWLSDSDRKTKPFADYRRVQMADTVNDPVSDLLATVKERQDAAVTTNQEGTPASNGAKETEPTAPRNSGETGYSVEARFHKKKGIDIYAVKFDEHFSREKFLELKGKVKDFGGYYSSFGKGGFIFENGEEAARKFAESVTKDIKNEQEQQRAADTEAVANEAEAVAIKAERLAEVTAPKEHEVSKAVSDIDTALDKVNKQLALLGFYESGEDVPFHESYGYMKSAEAKALKDANALAKHIGNRIGVDIGRKKVAKANIAPIGGDITIRLPLGEGKELFIDIMLNNDNDNLRMRNSYFRVESTGNSHSFGVNQWFDAGEPLDQLLNRIESEVRRSAPEYVITQIAQKGASKPRQAKVIEPSSLMGDLFSQPSPESVKKWDEAKGVVKNVISGAQDIVTDEQRDIMQQWVDEATSQVGDNPTDEADRGITNAMNAIKDYEQKKADDYQSQRSPFQKPLFPKNGDELMRECESSLKEAYMSGDGDEAERLEAKLQDLYVKKLTDEGVGLFEQIDRWKSYSDNLVIEWDKEKAAKKPVKPSADRHGHEIGDKVIYKGEEATIHDFEPDGRPVLDTGLAPVIYELVDWEDVSEKPSEKPKKDVSLQQETETISENTDEQTRATTTENASGHEPMGTDEAGTDGGIPSGGAGGAVSNRNTGAEPSGNRRGNVGRKKRAIEAGSLFDAGDFGAVETPASGTVRVREGRRNDVAGPGESGSRQDGGRRTGENEGERQIESASNKPDVANGHGDRRVDDGSVKTANEIATPLNTRNYLYPKDASNIDNMSPRERLSTNVRALEILRDLLHEGREASPEERAELGKFRGWGGVDTSRWYDLDYMRRLSNDRYTAGGDDIARLADILSELDPDGKRNLLDGIRSAGLTSYYTPTSVARSINKFFELAGYNGGGSFLDGSMGNGVLEGTMPKSIQQRTQIYGTELDWLTGQIAKQLYPDANIKIQGFQDIDMAEGSVDLAGSNIPFGDIKVYDKTWGHTSDPVKRAAQGKIHNYFVVKKISLVKPGGLLYIMTSNAVMDTKSNQIIRQHIADECEILGAMRLPDNTFKGAGTKVVTDVIFLRKYKDGEDMAATRQGDYLDNVEKPFLSTATTEAQGRTRSYNVSFNGYYEAHPDMMIGTVKAGGQYREDEFSLTSDLSTEDIAKKMDALMKKHVVTSNRAGSLYDTHKGERKVYQAIRESYKGESGDYVSNGNLVEQGGKFGVVNVTKGNAEFQEVPGLKSQGPKIRLMVPLRTAMKKLISLEIDGADDATLTETRKALKSAYDNYVKKFGRLQDKASKYIMDDIDGYTLLSLEKWKDGKFEGLSDIFTKSVIKPRINLDNASTPSELITLSLAEYGDIRDSFMRDKLGDNWLEQCGDSLFEIPFTGGYQIRDLYLSGDVKSKLFDAERAAQSNPAFNRNVEALKSVLPKDIPFVGIGIHMGARWVPEHIYTDFLCDLLGITERNPKSRITYMPEADQFQVYVSALEPSGKAKEFSTTHKKPEDLIEAALKNDKVKVTVTTPSGNQLVLQEETDSANDKVQAIREKFEDFIGADRNRIQELESLYNEKYNRTVIPHYDGSHLQVPGLQGMELRPHQKDAVWMLINNRGGIIDHIVGAGKTLVMQASIMEMRRMGIAKKPMILALKATVPQMAAEFRQAFPAARILAPTEKDFSTQNRKKLLSNIALNDWDCVILSHEQYGMLAHTEEVETGVFREQIEQLESAISMLHGDISQMTKKQLKGLEKRKKSLEAKMQKLLDRKVDREFTFENLGVDYLFVDECQQFKNLPYVTTHQNVAGLSSPEGSNRAVALLCGARYLQQLHQGDRGLVLLSGTTISNSLVELYSLFQYVRPNKMKELGFSTFDAWAANFAENSSELEYNHTNELVMRSRFRTFDNVPELAKLYTEVADVRNDLNLKLPKPKMRVHEVIVPASDALAEISEECVNMCNTKNGSYFGIPEKTASGKDQPWALLATNISTKAAISVKLVNPALDDGDGGKVRYVCDNVKKIYDQFHEQKGTQMIFCDLGVPDPSKEYDVYNDIINRLVNDYGIPRDQIVDIHVANNDQKKKALFKKVNDGDVRVLIAGAKNGGTGVNVQKRLIAIHHVDMSWNPANITQENGRGARQGNWLAKEFNDNNVEIFYYATEKSLDLYKYQLVSTKQNMIDKFKAGATSNERSFDEGDAGDDKDFNPASVVALLSGNPIIMEKAKMDKKVDKLIKAKRQYMVEHEQRVYDYHADQQHLKNFESLLERNAGDVQVLKDNNFVPGKDGVYPATVTVYSDKAPDKQTFDKPGEAGKRIKYLVNSGDKVTLEAFGMTATVGFPEETITGDMVRNVRLNAPSGISYSVSLSTDDTAAGTTMRRLLAQVIQNQDKYKAAVENCKHKLEGGDPGEAKFPKEEELRQMLEKKKEIDAEYSKLSADKSKENAEGGSNGEDGQTMKRRGAAASSPTEMQMQAYREAAIKTAEQLGGTEVHFDQRTAEGDVKGWFDTGDNSVHVVMDAVESIDDLRHTIFHEKLGHEGLKALFGSNEGVNQWGQFIFGSAGKKLRKRIVERADREGYGWDDPMRFSKAAQEVFADIAEAGPRTKDEFSLWRKVKHHLINRLNDLGLRIPGILNDHDLRYYVLKTGEALKKWDGMSAEAQSEAGNRMYSRAGKPRKRKDESMAQYLQRLRSWEKWRIAEETSQAAGDPQPDKAAIDKKWEDQYNAAMESWRTDNGINPGENSAGEFPKRQPGESPQEYAMRVADYEERADKWKDAPNYFDYMQRANEEYRDEYEAWKSRYNLMEAENVDLNMYDGGDSNNPFDTGDPVNQEVEARVEKDLAQAVGVAVDSDGARRQAKIAVIERRKNLESSNAEDAIWIYNLRKKIDEAAKTMSERTGEPVSGKQLREALPQIIEGTYFEEIIRDENGNVITINDISDQLPIKKGPELDAILSDIKDWYDEFYHVLEDAGLRNDAGYIAEGYVNHVWDKGKSDPKAWEKYIENYQRTKSPNMRHREIDTYREGIDIGLVPKYNDICDIIAHYSRQNNEAVANKKFLDDLSFIVVEERNSEGEVTANLPLLDSKKPSFTSDRYVMYSVPGVGDVWVLKDVQKRFASVFGTMRTPDVSDWLSKLGKGYDLTGSTMKKIQLSISGFHMGALTEVAMAQMRPDRAMQALFQYIIYDSFIKQGTVPAYAHPEDFKFAASHLVQLGATEDYAASDVNAITATFRKKMKEWYDEENKGKKVAGAAATPLAFALDMVNKGMDKVLWNYLHDGLKIACFKMFAEQVDERVKKEGLSDEMREQLLDEAGQYVNDTFGGQYWELLNVSPGLLKWLRRAFLSPDWLISTQRHFFANFGFGSLYSEGGFMEYLRYNADNIKRVFGVDVSRNELRRFRSSNAKKCYILGVCGFFYTMMNAINAFFRAKDEENEKAKAEEIRKENPDYRSPYELSYPDGMKWYDYTMLGNSIGQQTHLFMGRYEDGTETYVRWGKQFREFPEMFMGRHGVEFPTPLIERMMGKSNPMISLTRDNLGALGVWGFTNSKDIEEIQSKYGKEIGVLAMNARHFLPFTVPTQAEKEFKAIDLVMPSQKGFTRYKAVDFFKTYILAGDMEGVTRTYQAAVMNGIDAEKCLKAAISTIKATQRAEMKDGVTDLQSAMDKFDAADEDSENAYLTKSVLRNKIIAYLAESNYKSFTREDAQEQIDAFLQGDGVAEKDSEKYIALLKSDDVRDDYRLSVIAKQAKTYVDKVKTCEDVALQRELGRRYGAWFAIYGIANKARSRMNRLKSQLGKGHDAEVMEQIRQVRRQAQTEIDHVQPPR